MSNNNRLDRLERQARNTRRVLVATLIVMAMVAVSGLSAYLDDAGDSYVPVSLSWRKA
ncbi:hypothetical protein P3W85_29780 [Cupriavidus basilensis]|uniref:Uncharacterized protein n=1 Tax=Cupriavidus basilensis TaxID=68895 RepID=A0ABT6AWV5_9BURK|nr:hypothetical protein [Cupriavidus basilensis]MDF3837113.1 hypothetical protein [Cupriavidus basilensis]